MVVNITNIFQKTKKINLISVEKKDYKMKKKRFITIIRKYFNL